MPMNEALFYQVSDVNIVHIKELKLSFSSYIRRYVQPNTWVKSWVCPALEMELCWLVFLNLKFFLQCFLAHGHFPVWFPDWLKNRGLVTLSVWRRRSKSSWWSETNPWVLSKPTLSMPSCLWVSNVVFHTSLTKHGCHSGGCQDFTLS